ncbi:MAG TPA: hypothetical protein VKB50_12930 [Vicinamibacterales bacterium]|nr:hypothetical protein [Vicinamibacterales bacterium]
MKTRLLRLLIPAVLGFLGTLTLVARQFDEIELTHPAIQYARSSNDQISALLRRPESTKALTSDGPSGYLRSLLQALEIPVSSQIMVFSQGSVQSDRIRASNPRALYFNDSTVVGWVRGGFIEIAAQDPEQGTVFYTLNSSGLGGLSLSRFDGCLSCHNSNRSGGIPGMIEPMGHSRPLERRWGGWYVTGNLGSIEHFGNVDLLTAGSAPPTKPATLTSLERTFDTRGYLTPYSDIAALMVFEHQMQIINLMTRVGWETRVARHEKQLDARRAALRERVAQLVDYMLFIDEAPIGSKLEGTSGFAEAFSARGPRDSQGRSLRQLDLNRRLLRFPCSYMIYSVQFDRLPAEAKAAIYERLWVILSGKDTDVRYRRLSAADRRAIVDILRETKPDLPKYFTS